VHEQLQDWLFARLAGFDGPLPSISPGPAPETVPGADRAESAAPPAIRSEADLRMATEWLRRERARLEEYTRSQLGGIQREREALARQKSAAEQALFLRVQELSRKEEMILAQGQSMHKQAEELAQREQRLAAHLQAWQTTPGQAPGGQSAGQPGEQSPAQQALLETLKSETASLHAARAVAQEELRNLIAATEDLKKTRAAEEENLRTRQALLEQRLVEADQAILASQQRQTELEDLELRLYHEVQEQERDLIRQRQELEVFQRQLRGASVTP
jgi:hypothetical protein